MSQRASGYARRADDDYPTPRWVPAVLAPWLRARGVARIWEPAAGAGLLVRALMAEGFEVIPSHGDFFTLVETPLADAIVTNPPYGNAERNGNMAASFIRTALVREVRIIAMLLRVDFDSGKTRRDIFGDCAAFAGKLVLLDRIKWFEGPAGPSDNHAWFMWDHRHQGPPAISYAARPPQ